jgi:hypothetical protein
VDFKDEIGTLLDAATISLLGVFLVRALALAAELELSRPLELVAVGFHLPFLRIKTAIGLKRRLQENSGGFRHLSAIWKR